jgi:hypothetical protein
MTDLRVLDMPTAQLVFGVRWCALLGGNRARVARSYSRRFKATHAVVMGQPAALVGVASPPSVRRGQALHSAAANVARLFPAGTHGLVCHVPSCGWWLVAVHEGLPIARTDRFFDSCDSALAELGELRQTYPRLVILGQGHSPKLPSLAEIESASHPTTELGKISRVAPLLLPGVVLCLSVLVAVFVFSRYRAGHTTQHTDAALGNHQTQQRWNMAVQQSASGHVVHGASGLQQLLLSLGNMPVQQQGWVLGSVVCTSVLARWNCQASYSRASRSATAEKFRKTQSFNAAIAFPTLDSASVKWHFTVPSVALNLVRLETARYVHDAWLSGLQQVDAAFNAIAIEPATPLPVAAPTGAKGEPLPTPASLQVFVQRRITLKGPLRSVSLLLPQARFMTWHSLKLTLRPNPAPGIRSSSLMAELQGVLYEKTS